MVVDGPSIASGTRSDDQSHKHTHTHTHTHKADVKENYQKIVNENEIERK